MPLALSEYIEVVIWRECKGEKLIMRTNAFTLAVLGCAIAGTTHAQTGFSADLVDLQRPGTPIVAKINFSEDRMRVEPQNMTPRNAPPIIFLIYLKTQTSIAVLPQQRVYAEIPMPESWAMYTYFLSGDVDDACGGWDRVLHHHNPTCRKAGNETLNGRKAVRYEARCSHTDSCPFWIDRTLHFLSKWKDGSKGNELRNVQEGVQAASLFAIPAGFKKQKATTGTVRSN